MVLEPYLMIVNRLAPVRCLKLGTSIIDILKAVSTLQESSDTEVLAFSNILYPYFIAANVKYSSVSADSLLHKAVIKGSEQ
jgi:hypothetical protein